MGKNADHSADPTRTDSWKTSDRILEGRIAQTSAQVRRVDFFSALIAVLAIGSSLLLFGILLDHHCFAHGLSKEARSLYLGTILAVSAAWFLYRIFPLLRYRINPLYAADILEKSRPSLKNGLINWLFLRRRRFGKGPDAKSDAPLERKFYHELSVRTAEELSTLSQEMVVDHSSIIRWGIAFAVVFAILSIYSVFSAKSPFVSTARILFPTAEIEPPQAVRFQRIEPGDASFYQGKTIRIEAEIAGTRNQPVYFAYSTSDGRLTDQRIPMESPGVNLFELTFPADGTGLTESLDYRLIVGEPGRGESRSKSFHLNVRPAMSFGVLRVTYDYPAYSGLKRRQTENQGDLRAWDGTRVEIAARSNVPMEKALFIPDFKMNEGKSMTVSAVDPTTATLSFVLKTRHNDKTGARVPEFESYQLLCVDGDKNRNIEEPENPNNGANRYKIEVMDDPSPFIRWEKIPEGELQIPADGRLPVRLAAGDSDFGLRRVQIDFRYKEGQGEQTDPNRVVNREIPSLDLSSFLTDSSSEGEISLTGVIVPENLGLTAGDSVEFQGIATDNREPKGNQAETEPLTFTVIAPENRDGESDSPKEEEEKKGTKGENDGSSSNEKGDSGDEGTPDSNGGQGDEDDSSSEKEDSSGGQGENESSGHQESPKENGATSDSDKGSGQSGSSQEGEESGASGGEESDPDGSDKSDGSGESTDANQSDNRDAAGSGGQNGNRDHSSEKDEHSAPGQDVNQSPTDNENAPDGDSAPSENGRPTGESGESTDPNGKRGPDDSESARKGEKPASAPIDPEANPGDAFETILDLMAEAVAAEPAPVSAAPQGIGTGITNPDSAKKGSDQEVDPDKLKTADGTPPPDAKRQTDDSPHEIPPGARRDRGEVDPAAQNFMATAPREGETSGGADVSPDANVLLDPDRSVEGTPARPDESQGRDAHRPSPGDSDSPNGPSRNDPNPSDEDSLSKSSPSGQTEQNSSNLPSNSGGTPSEASNVPVTPPTGFTPPDAKNGSPSGNPGQGETDGLTPESRSDGSKPNGDDKTAANFQGGGGTALGTLSSEETLLQADRANLAYSEKATALALEYLEDQLQKGTDSELLDRLGWSEEELRRFWLRWKEMKESAGHLPSYAPERRDYLEALRDLGLRPSVKEGGLTAERKGDEFRKSSPNRENLRIEPPRDFQDRFRLYNQGISRQK